jgi:hypothetical protein
LSRCPSGKQSPPPPATSSIVHRPSFIVPADIIPAGTRVCDRILIMLQFFKVCSAYQIPILILKYEGTSYASRSSFVSQVQIGSCHSAWPESVIAT